MADDVEKMNLAFDRVLESFKYKNLKDSQRDALEKLVGGQDVFVIQPTGSGKSETFPFNLVLFRESVSSEPQKTQPLFELNFFGVSPLSRLPSIRRAKKHFAIYINVPKIIWVCARPDAISRQINKKIGVRFHLQ